MNPVVGGTLLPPMSLQQPASVAYANAPADGAAMGAARVDSRFDSVSRFDSAMAASPPARVAASGAISSVTHVSMAQAVPSRAAPPHAANDVAAVSNVQGVPGVSTVHASPNATGVSGVSGVRDVQPVEHTNGPHAAYNDRNGLTRLPNGVDVLNGPDAAIAPGAIDPSQATDPAASMGDRILSSLRSVSDGAAHTWNSLGQLAHSSSGDMNVSQMMSFQIGVMKASVQFDYVGKIISRATQNLDQLVKTQ